MKNVLKVTFLYIGLVIGAGFASGREILEFFNFKNREDFTGIILAATVFSFVVYIILIKSKHYQTNDFFEFTDLVSGKAGYYIKKFMFLYMFAGFFVMLSAGGTLCSFSLGCEKKLGIIFMTVFCFFVLVFESKGIVILNSILVPIMIAGILYISISSILFGSVTTFTGFDKVKNNFLASAVCYVSYNTINAGAVLVPCSSEISEKEIKISALLSGIILGTLIFVVWLVQNVFFDEIYTSEFPMLDIAARQGELQKNIYSLILFMSICTTAVSCGYGVLSTFKLKKKSEKILAVLILCLLAAPLAYLEFSALVAQVYSMFGYVGLIWIVFLFKSLC